MLCSSRLSQLVSNRASHFAQSCSFVPSCGGLFNLAPTAAEITVTGKAAKEAVISVGSSRVMPGSSRTTLKWSWGQGFIPAPYLLSSNSLGCEACASPHSQGPVLSRCNQSPQGAFTRAQLPGRKRESLSPVRPRELSNSQFYTWDSSCSRRIPCPTSFRVFLQLPSFSKGLAGRIGVPSTRRTNRLQDSTPCQDLSGPPAPAAPLGG